MDPGLGGHIFFKAAPGPNPIDPILRTKLSLFFLFFLKKKVAVNNLKISFLPRKEL